MSNGFEDGETLSLTQHQKNICLMLAQGLENKEIAYIMGITEGTVKNHVTDIMRRLCALNRAHCVALAIKKKLINLRYVEEGKDFVRPLPSVVPVPFSRQPVGTGGRRISRVP